MGEAIILNIGRDENAEIILNHESVSALHAEVSIKYYDHIYIRDLDSSNGTFVNDRRIITAKINPNDSLRFGSFTPLNSEFFSEIFRKYKERKTDFKREFREVLSNFKIYQNELDRLQNQPKGPILFRFILGISVILVLVFFPDLIPNDQVRISLMLGVGIFSLLGNIFAKSTGKRNKEMALLKLKYEEILVCPKCTTSLLGQNISYWDGKKKCQNVNCNAVYKD